MRTPLILLCLSAFACGPDGPSLALAPAGEEASGGGNESEKLSFMQLWYSSRGSDGSISHHVSLDLKNRLAYASDSTGNSNRYVLPAESSILNNANALVPSALADYYSDSPDPVGDGTAVMILLTTNTHKKPIYIDAIQSSSVPSHIFDIWKICAGGNLK